MRAIEGESADPTPATASFKVEATPPQTTITSAPSGRVPIGPVSFDFSSGESGASFECSLDGESFSSCASPYELPSPEAGPHEFRVRAVNAAGVIDASPDSAAWSSVEPEHDLCGSIEHDTTIGPDYASVYTLDNCTLDVPSGVTLTVAPGTVVKSSEGATCSTYECSISVEGALDAIGTASEPITFTSLNDDSVGGETGSGEPEAREWEGIAAVGLSATLDIEHATIAYARLAVQTLNSGAVTLNDDQINAAQTGVSSPNDGAGSPITLTNSSIEGGVSVNCAPSLTVTGNTIIGESGGRGIENYCNAFGSAVESVVDIANNHVTIPADDGGRPAISVAAANLDFAALESNTITAPSASDAVAVDGEVNASQTMSAAPFTWEISGGVADVPSGVTLTVAPGTVVKSSEGATCSTYECSISVEGALDAIGTASEPITFTSLNDDSVGGETGSGEPEAREWEGIAAVGLSATLDIEHATIAYARLAVQTLNSGAVTLNDDQINAAQTGVSSPNDGAGSPITLTNSSIEGGVSVNCAPSLTVTGNTIIGESGGRGIENYCNAFGSAVESVVDIANNHVTIPADDGGRPAISVAAANLDFAALESNTITAPSASDAVAVDGEVNASQTMSAAPFTWEISGGVVDVPSGVTLTVAPGTVVKSSEGATCSTYECSISVEGALDAIGTASEPITFTSLNDDSVGGETGSGEPEAREWEGIAAVGLSATLDIEHATIAYARLAVQTLNSGAVTLNDDQINAAQTGVSSPNDGAGSPITLTNSSIEGGVSVNCAPSLTVTGNTIIGESGGRGIENYCNAFGSAVESVVDIANNHVTIPADDGGRPAISVAAANLDFAALESNTITAPSASDAVAVDGEVNASQTMSAAPFTWEISGGVVDVPSGVTLTVAPGTVVKSSEGATCSTYECSISVEGALDAIGTASEPITFTSLNDDSVGGETGSGEPEAREWEGIAAVGLSATLDIEHATIAYARLAVQTLNSGAVTLNDDQINAAQTGVSSPNDGAGSPITLTNSSIEGGVSVNCAPSLTVTGNTIIGESGGRGIENYCNAFGSAVESVVDIANNHVTIPADDGGRPAISVAAANLDFAALESNTITAPSASDAVAVDGEVNASQTMSAAPFTWEISGGVVDVPSGVTLTVAPGTVVKSSEGATCSTYECSISVEGALDAIGTASEPITFTSLNDDSVGGETSREEEEPKAGDWAGIYFADVQNVELSHLDIRYAAAAIDFGLLDTATISNSDFVYNEAAIEVAGTADNDPALGALACVPPYLSFVTVSDDWFGKHGSPTPSIDISSVIGAILPDEYSSLFTAASSFTDLSASFGEDNTIPFSIYSCPELGIPPFPVTPVILEKISSTPWFPDPETE